MKSCRIMDHCCGKNPLNFGIDLIQNGQMAAILDYCCNVLHVKQVHSDMGISSKVTVGIGRGMRCSECL